MASNPSSGPFLTSSRNIIILCNQSVGVGYSVNQETLTGFSVAVQSEFPVPPFSQHVELFGSVVTICLAFQVLPVLECIVGSVTMFNQFLLVLKHSMLLLRIWPACSQHVSVLPCI